MSDTALDAAELAAQLASLTAEYEDLKLLYDAMIEHGEAVEDQLAESNLALQKTQRRLEAELDDAARYVMSILPEPRKAEPLADWLLVPSTELGGDSFGYHDIDEDHLALYLLDVCGHGVGAALLSVTVINVLRASALRGADFHDPSSVLAALNDAFPMETQNDMFFTIWFGVYQRSTGRLTFATGGHPPAIHIKGPADQREAALLATPGRLAIGAMEGMEYSASQVTVSRGDELLLLSDGTFEIDGVGSDMLSVERLAEFALGDSDPKSILAWVRSFGDGGPLPDDFSLLRLRF